ncbi:MAG: alpha-galactosidase, partial [Bacteroidota bacterium]|nr:alpha-galactosidase [Bacteroidota bacterium]
KLENGRLHLTACIPGLQIRLQPGEEISGPRMLIGGYHGALAEGSNRLRKLIRLHYTPKLDAKPFAPVATYDHWWDVWTNFDEPLLRKLADAAAEIGQEYFLLDAGWYSGITNPDDFGTGLGNWDDVDSVKFPQGLQPFSNYLTTKGLHFGLWFEPERVAGGSWLARQHPDWVIWLASGPGKEAPDHTGQYGLLNYGLPAVQEWVEKLFDRYISKFDVRYIRYDFNLDPLSYWDSADTDGRRGIAQIRHIEGFYKVIDWVRTHHPKTILEGCASGGRRIDLETARRFHTFWISDQTSEPDIVRWHLHGLNYFLPGNYQYVCFARPKPELEPESSFQDFLGGAFGVGGRIDQWTPETKARTEKHVDVFKKLRRFLMEDYYPLTLQSKDLKSWEAWQFHDPHTQEGFVQAFRLKSEDSSFYVCPRGLQSDAYYRFVDVYSGESLELEGTAAMERGLAFHLAKDESKVFTYQKISYTKK